MFRATSVDGTPITSGRTQNELQPSTEQDDEQEISDYDQESEGEDTSALDRSNVNVREYQQS